MLLRIVMVSVRDHDRLLRHVDEVLRTRRQEGQGKPPTLPTVSGP
jgi:hypothetical protein